MSIESVMPTNHLILCHPLLLPSVSPASGSFPVSQPRQVAKGLELQAQHQSFQLHGLHCPKVCGILVSQPGVKPMSHALGSGFFTPGPPRKSLSCVLEQERRKHRFRVLADGWFPSCHPCPWTAPPQIVPPGPYTCAPRCKALWGSLFPHSKGWALLLSPGPWAGGSSSSIHS